MLVSPFFCSFCLFSSFFEDFFIFFQGFRVTGFRCFLNRSGFLLSFPIGFFIAFPVTFSSCFFFCKNLLILFLCLFIPGFRSSLDSGSFLFPLLGKPSGIRPLSLPFFFLFIFLLLYLPFSFLFQFFLGDWNRKLTDKIEININPLCAFCSPSASWTAILSMNS